MSLQREHKAGDFARRTITMVLWSPLAIGNTPFEFQRTNVSSAPTPLADPIVRVYILYHLGR